MTASESIRFETLPKQTSGASAPGWWGMIFLLATEFTLFASLIASYFYLRSGQPVWPPDGTKLPDLPIPIAMTCVLILSSVPMFWATHGIRKGDQTALRFGLLLSFLLGATFIALQVWEYSREDSVFARNSYGSLFYTITALHGLHVTLGLLLIIYVSYRPGWGTSQSGDTSPSRTLRSIGTSWMPSGSWRSFRHSISCRGCFHERTEPRVHR